MREGKELKRVYLQPLIKRDKICKALTKRIERALKLMGSEELRSGNIIVYVTSTINREVRCK